MKTPEQSQWLHIDVLLSTLKSGGQEPSGNCPGRN